MRRYLGISIPSLLLLGSLAQSEVLVFLDSGVPTPELPDYRTFTVTAHSTVPGESIASVDFIGNPADENAATARGFFAPMHHVNPLGLPTVFNDYNPFFSAFGALPEQDSQFKYSQVTSPAGYSKEGPTFLRALFGGNPPLGETIDLAQLVLPYPLVPDIHFRGRFSVTRGGTIVELPETSGVFFFEAPLIPVNTDLGERPLGSLINHTLTVSSSAGDVVWDNLVTNGPNGQSPEHPPVLNPDGTFTWLANSNYQSRGQWTFDARVTDQFGSAIGHLSVFLVVPEPATACLLFAGSVGLVRRHRRR